MNKIRLAMVTDCLRLDGISTVIMNYCTHLDYNKFEIAIISGTPVSTVHKRKCDEMNISIIELPIRKKQKIKYYMELNGTLKKRNFDICHVHGNSATSSIELLLAALNGVNVRIMHCHNSTCQHKTIHNLLLPIFKRLYTQAFACSSLAGNWIFGENRFKIIPNGFETAKFRYKCVKRNYYRKQMNLDGCLVIGHVGQINHQKNTEFSIKLFETEFADDDWARLILVGNGRNKELYEEYIQNSICKNKIILYGESDDASGLLSAMDIFIFPSRYEGLGISVIEAQISGLPCVISDAVPKEVQISKNVIFLPIGEENFKNWSTAIRSFASSKTNREKVFETNISNIEKYNICNCTRMLETEYELLLYKQKIPNGR